MGGDFAKKLCPGWGYCQENYPTPDPPRVGWLAEKFEPHIINIFIFILEIVCDAAILTLGLVEMVR